MITIYKKVLVSCNHNKTIIELRLDDHYLQKDTLDHNKNNRVTELRLIS
jgi:hypothetical protein